MELERHSRNPRPDGAFHGAARGRGVGGGGGRGKREGCVGERSHSATTKRNSVPRRAPFRRQIGHLPGLLQAEPGHALAADMFVGHERGRVGGGHAGQAVDERAKTVDAA